MPLTHRFCAVNVRLALRVHSGRSHGFRQPRTQGPTARTDLHHSRQGALQSSPHRYHGVTDTSGESKVTHGFSTVRALVALTLCGLTASDTCTPCKQGPHGTSLPKEEAWQGSDWQSIGHALDGSGHVETSPALGRVTEHG